MAWYLQIRFFATPSWIWLLVAIRGIVALLSLLACCIELEWVYLLHLSSVNIIQCLRKDFRYVESSYRSPSMSRVVPVSNAEMHLHLGLEWVVVASLEKAKTALGAKYVSHVSFCKSMTWVSTELTSVLAAFPLATLALPFLKSQITSVSMMVCGDTFTTSLAAESSLKLWLRWRRRRRLNFWWFLMREGYLPSSPCKDLQDNRQCFFAVFSPSMWDRSREALRLCRVPWSRDQCGTC